MLSWGLIMFVGMFVVGVMGMMQSYGHMLMMLVSLEFMVLMFFLMSMVSLVKMCQYISVVLLVFTVCEGALGLTILVSMARNFSGDYLNTFYLSY